jgi:RNA polymerase sigma-70 factor, ECF subfamily
MLKMLSPAALIFKHAAYIGEVAMTFNIRTGKRPDVATLTREAQAGDREALDELFARYRAPLFRTAIRICKNSEDAEEAVQDGLLLAFRRLDMFEGRSHFLTWLTRIVMNASLMKLRRKRAHVMVSINQENPIEGGEALEKLLQYPGPDPEQICAQSETVKILERHVEGLPHRMQTALKLRAYCELSTREAAEAAGMTPGSVKSNLFRARAQLSRVLNESAGKAGHLEPVKSTGVICRREWCRHRSPREIQARLGAG